MLYDLPESSVHFTISCHKSCLWLINSFVSCNFLHPSSRQPDFNVSNTQYTIRLHTPHVHKYTTLKKIRSNSYIIGHVSIMLENEAGCTWGQEVHTFHVNL